MSDLTLVLFEYADSKKDGEEIDKAKAKGIVPSLLTQDEVLEGLLPFKESFVATLDQDSLRQESDFGGEFASGFFSKVPDAGVSFSSYASTPADRLDFGEGDQVYFTFTAECDNPKEISDKEIARISQKDWEYVVVSGHTFSEDDGYLLDKAVVAAVASEFAQGLTAKIKDVKGIDGDMKKAASSVVDEMKSRYQETGDNVYNLGAVPQDLLAVLKTQKISEMTATAIENMKTDLTQTYRQEIVHAFLGGL